MLGAVELPPGGLPRLPSLTHLKFYLPDERNWGEWFHCTGWHPRAWGRGGGGCVSGDGRAVPARSSSLRDLALE